MTVERLAVTILILAACANEIFSQTIYSSYWFNEEQKAQIIQIHNRLRAGEPASNMQEMVWDDRLAALAHDHTLTCNAWHRDAYERRGHGYFYIGENIWWSNEPYLRWNLQSCMYDFYNEKPYYNYYTGVCSTIATCGHYTQFVWADTCAVGCAAVYCDGIKNGRGITRGHIIVCNYGEGGNTFGVAPFRMGKRCTECAGGGGCTSEGLCAPTCAGRRYPANSYIPPPAPTYSFPSRPAPLVKHWTYKLGVSQKERKNWPRKSRIEINRTTKCADYNAKCGEWASKGECKRNFDYMTRYCARSCRFCVRRSI